MDPVSTAYADDPDAQDLLAVGRGDDARLRPIVERWQGPLINFLYRSTHSYELSEDLAQQVFVRLYRSAGRYRPTAKFSTYLFQIARRLLINEFRKQSRRPLDIVDPADLGGSVSGREPLNQLEIEEAFAAALRHLPENQQTALLLLKQQELSYEEIAEIMQASLSAVKTWIHRGRTRLKELLADQL